MNKYQEAFNKIKEDIEYSHSEMKAFDLESKKQILFIKTASKVCLNTLQEACEKAEKYNEKETPKKVKVIDEPDLYYIYYCPSCGATLMVDRDKHPKHLFNYCGKCRQKLDWN